MSAPVDADIEPPGLNLFDGDDGDDEPDTDVYVSIVEVDGTRRSGHMSVKGDVDDDDALADMLVRALLGAAAMRGPDLTAAVVRAMHRHFVRHVTPR